MTPLFAFGEGLLAPSHLLVLLVLGLLIFGRRLPEVGRSLGATLKEFKKGLRGLEDDDLGSGPMAPPRLPPAGPTPPHGAAGTEI